MSKIDQIHHAACSVQNNVEDIRDIKTSHNRFLTDFLKFISLLSEMSKMCTNYNIDSNTLDLLWITTEFELKLQIKAISN